MLLSSSPLKTKKYLTKDQNSCVILLIGICYIFSILLLFCGSEEFYKLNTLIIGHCQVKSIDLKSLRNNYFPRWNITVLYKNQTNNDILIASYGTKSDKWAWIKARKYQINQTYPCYRSRNETSIIQWGWQWDQPIKWKTYAFLFNGVLLFLIATGIIMFKQRYQVKFQNTGQQHEYHQLKTLIKSEEQQERTAPP